MASGVGIPTACDPVLGLVSYFTSSATAYAVLSHAGPSLQDRSTVSVCPQGRGPQTSPCHRQWQKWHPTPKPAQRQAGSTKILETGKLTAVKIAALPSSVYEVVQSS